MKCPAFKEFTDCKDPDSNLPYSFTWTGWLENEGALLVDNVNNREIIIVVEEGEEDTSPLTAGSIVTDIPNGIIYVWLTGGTAGLKYYVTCRITTDTGKIEDKTGIITCGEK